MAFARPSYAALVTRIRGDMKAQLIANGRSADPFLRRTRLWIVSLVYAAVAHIFHGLLEWLSLQLLASTATDDAYILLHGQQYGMTLVPASKATGSISTTGNGATLLPTGTQFARSDGVLVETTEDATPDVTATLVAAEAVEAGDEGNMEDGTSLTIVTPIVGIDSDATASGAWTDGADIEDVEDLRDRVLLRKRNVPHGGRKADYERWALEVAGVTRALCVPNARGGGTVDVYFLHEEGTGIGIPTAPQITAVQERIDDDDELYEEARPVLADVIVKAPTTTAVNFNLSVTPDTVDTRAAIEAELDALDLRNALRTDEDGDPVTTQLSEYFDAASGAAGVTGVDINSPTAHQTPSAPGVVLIRGTMTWV